MPSVSARTSTPAATPGAQETGGARAARRRAGGLLSLAIVLGVAAGCSSGGSPAPAPGTPTATAGAASPSPLTAPSPSEGQAPSAPAWPTGPTSLVRAPAPPPRLVGVTAAHDLTAGLSFDRVVLTFNGGVPGYTAHYVSKVISPGEGSPVPLAGQAFFEIVLRPATAHDDAGAPTVASPIAADGLPAIRQIALAGDFEGYVHLGIGLTGVTGYRVTELAGPDRLVFDFAGQATGAP